MGEDDGEHIDLLIDGCDDSVDDGGAEFLLNNGLNLFRDFGLGDRSQLFNDLLFGLGVRLNKRLKLALKLKLKKNDDIDTNSFSFPQKKSRMTTCIKY